MADVFAPVKRAPRSALRDLESVDGVRRVEGRIVFEVTLDIPEMPVPCSGRVISVPERRRKILAKYETDTVQAKARDSYRQLGENIRPPRKARSRFETAFEDEILQRLNRKTTITVHADPAEFAAWTVVGNTLLNLDEMFLKR